MQIYFVRHGETDWNAQGRMQGLSDTPLNDRGRVQAERIAGRFREEDGPFTGVYSSPLQRAWYTAQQIGAAVGLSPQVEPRLIEHAIGPLEGLTLSEINARYPEVYTAWTQGVTRPRFPGEEPRADLEGRLKALLDDWKARHQGQRIIAVTHGAALSTFLSLIIGLDSERRSPFWFENASLSIVDFTWPWARLRLVNDTGHLRHAAARPTDALTSYTAERAAVQEIQTQEGSNGDGSPPGEKP